jgi:gliding motility-associated-like protein
VVTINLTPVLDPVADVVICDEFTFGAILGTNLTGNQAYYTAPNGGGTQYNPGDLFNTPGLSTIYVYDATGTTPDCFDEVSFTINISITPVFTPTGSNPTQCAANDGTITLSGLTPGATYTVGYTANGTFVGPVVLTANAAGEVIITGLTAGSYSNFVVELNNCIGTDNTVINLVDPNAPAINAGPDVEVCEGEEITLTAVNPDGAIITWNNNITDGNPFNQNVGTTTYTVTANLDNCIATDQVNVTVHPTPNVFAGNDVLVCAGQSVVLTGAGAQTYVWNNGVTNGVAFTPAQTQTYTVTGTSQFGCVATDDVTVTVEELPTLSFQGDNLEGCAPVTTTFTNTGVTEPGSECVWYLSDGTVLTGCDNVAYTFNNPGCYDVTLEVTSANGCSSSTTLQDYVCVQAYPVAYFIFSPNQPTTINTSVSFTNGSIGASNYQWFFGDGATSNAVDPTHTYPEIEGSYVVTLVASTPFGCTDTVQSIVNVVKELIFYVPNTFTPDGDDFNETFQPVFTSGYDPFDFHLMIFNRWGELIFESYDASIGWDGTYGGKANGGELVKDGTYVWKIEVKTKLNDERKMFVGHVNVLK